MSDAERPYYFLVTPGACGTVGLHGFLHQHCGMQMLPGWNTHTRGVPKLAAINKFVYLYSDPRDALLSQARREALIDVHAKHVRNMGGDVAGFMAACIYGQLGNDLRRYLANGVDFFDFEGHFDSWLNHPDHVNVMFVKYEELPQHLPAMLERWGQDPALAAGFEWKPRQSNWRDENPIDQTLLERMFYSHIQRIESLDGCFVC